MLVPRGMICLKKENIKQRLGPTVMFAKRAGGMAKGPPRVISYMERFTQPCKPVVSEKGK